MSSVERQLDLVLVVSVVVCILAGYGLHPPARHGLVQPNDEDFGGAWFFVLRGVDVLDELLVKHAPFLPLEKTFELLPVGELGRMAVTIIVLRHLDVLKTVYSFVNSSSFTCG